MFRTDVKDGIISWARGAFGIQPAEGLVVKYVDEDFGEIAVDDCGELPDKGHVVIQTVFAEPSELRFDGMSETASDVTRKVRLVHFSTLRDNFGGQGMGVW